MKKSIITSMLIGGLIFNLSAGTSSVYAQTSSSTSFAKKTVSSVSAKSSIEFTEEKTVKSNYDGGQALLTDQDGKTYFYGRDGKKMVIYVLSADGKKGASISIPYRTRNGVTVYPGSPKMKLSGENIYLFYNESTETSNVSLICTKLDKKLKVKEQYDLSTLCRDTQFIDTNGKQIVYARSKSTIYICDMNGKNKKRLFTVSDSSKSDYIDSIAVNGNSVAFAGKSGYYGKEKFYIGLIDLKTGKVSEIKRDGVEFPRAFDDHLLWYGGTGGMNPKDGSYGFEASYIYSLKSNGTKIKATKTETGGEAGYLQGCISDDGKIFTCEIIRAEPAKACIRVYENGICKGKITVNIGAGLSGFSANGGTVAISYCEKLTDRSVKTTFISY